MSIPWREAASVIIAAKSSDKTSPTSSEFDYKLLVTRRSGRSSFLANAFCFPGGHIEKADFSADWWSVFSDQEVYRGHLNALIVKDVPKSPIMTTPQILESLSKAKDFLPPELALRISAIRETFEESGVLLATTGDEFKSNNNPGSSCSLTKSNSYFPDTEELKDWQLKVHKDPRYFIELFQVLNLIPDLKSLHPWWNWLTPPTVGHKRFDTMFYIICLDSIPQHRSDESEVSSIHWLSPKEVLMEQLKGSAFLAPPQVYELARLSNFTEINKLKTFSFQRESKGIERWCANVTGLADGALLALPGDDCFDLTLNSDQLPSLSEMKRENMNRLELRAPIFFPICTPSVQLTCGHVRPIPINPDTIKANSNDNLRGEEDVTSSGIVSMRLQSNL